MEDIVLQTEHLTKKYGSFTVLDNVSVKLRKKHIYGFIGENGAGKSTFMKIVTGLTYPTEGTYSLFGRSAASEREKMRRYIGSIIEEPSLYSGYSVLQNLELQRILAGNPDKSVCGKVLDMVELSEAKHKKVRTLSMGMKQRLSIALALTGNPQLLILDVKWSTVLIVYRVYSVQKKRKKERYAQIEPKFVYSVINIKNEEAGGRAYPGSRFLLPKLKKEAQDTCVLLGTAFSDRDGIVLT